MLCYDTEKILTMSKSTAEFRLLLISNDLNLSNDCKLTSPRVLGSWDRSQQDSKGIYSIYQWLELIDNSRIRNRGIYSTRKQKLKIICLQILKSRHWETLALMSPNVYARYLYCNKSDKLKGIKNMHLNIRSLGYKVFEIKHNPNVLGISECELRKYKSTFDEAKL